MSQGTVANTTNECIRDWATSKGVEKNVEAVILDDLGIFLLPIASSDNHVLGSFRSKEICLFLAPDDVEERDSDSLGAFVELSSQG